MTLLTIGVWLIILLILGFLVELRKALHPPAPPPPPPRRNWLGLVFAFWLVMLVYYKVQLWLH